VSVLTKPIALPRLRAPRLPALSRPTPNVTGLEIGATRVIAAHARVQDGRIATDRAAARALTPGLVRDGVVVDPDGLARDLRALFSEHRFGKRVRVGLAAPRTVLRVIDLPPLEERDVRAALRMQAQESIPMPLDRAVLDYQTVGLVDTPVGRRLRVVVVATERDGVDRLLEAVRRAGLKPVGIDLSIFALIRALRSHAPSDGPVLYAHLGDLANVAIAEAGLCRFTRLAPQGMATVLERIAERQAIPTEHALALLEHTAAQAAGAEPDAVAETIRDVLARTAIELGSELRTAAEFYATQFATGPVTTGILAGPLASLPGFAAALGAASGLTLACGEVAVNADGALRDLDPGLAALASGLAVGELGS
jgi:type IV pilus assembly protein PilM